MCVRLNQYYSGLSATSRMMSRSLDGVRSRNNGLNLWGGHNAHSNLVFHACIVFIVNYRSTSPFHELKPVLSSMTW